VALFRAKDLQAIELRERNIVIERTVNEQTNELAWTRDKAIEASLTKSDFLASMSHEIRTPLNAIIGMSELLSETKLTDEQKKYISVFRRAGDTLLSLVNNILDLSKIEAHQLKLEEIPFNLVDVVEESVEIYALKAAEKKVELVGRVDPLVNNHRLGDPTRLRQVILNLISNALKFTDHGEIIVNVTNPEGGHDLDEDDLDQLIFSIKDTGVGIPEKKLDAIFDSFTQADSSVTRKYGGTGLGLTISKNLVELMEGEIKVKSEENVGSTFTFNVVLSIDDTSIQVRSPKATIKLDDINILIVDDNVTNGMIINEILKAQGANVQIVENGKQALDKLASKAKKQDAFQLVVINCYLPDMDSFQLAEEIKSSNIEIITAMMISLNQQTIISIIFNQ